MVNQSGVTPCGHRLLVLPIEVEDKTEMGIILRTKDQNDREQMAQVEGTVVALGETCWKDQPDGIPWCKVGDSIVFAKYSGLVRKGKDGKEYRIINDLDVV